MAGGEWLVWLGLRLFVHKSSLDTPFLAFFFHLLAAAATSAAIALRRGAGNGEWPGLG